MTHIDSRRSRDLSLQSATPSGGGGGAEGEGGGGGGRRAQLVKLLVLDSVM